ncbi:MAG: hypothetical protein AABW83_03670 [Nanoarchaeota archaeon]
MAEKNSEVRIYHVNDGNTRKFYATNRYNSIHNYPFRAHLVKPDDDNKPNEEIIYQGSEVKVGGKELFHPKKTTVESVDIITQEQYQEFLKKNPTVRIYRITLKDKNEDGIIITNNENLIYLEGMFKSRLGTNYPVLTVNKSLIPTEEFIPIGNKVREGTVKKGFAECVYCLGTIIGYNNITIPEFNRIVLEREKLENNQSSDEKNIRERYRPNFEELEKSKRDLERNLEEKISKLGKVPSLEDLLKDKFII